MAAAEALANSLTAEDLKLGKVYPDVCDIRAVSKTVAIAVIKQALEENNCDHKFLAWTDDDISDFVRLIIFYIRNNCTH